MPEKIAIEIKQLNGKTLDNVSYKRREDTTLQIIASLRLEKTELRRRIADGDLKSETLVYLFREFLESDLRDEIYTVLSKRILAILFKRFHAKVKDFDDFAQNIQTDFLEKVCDFVTSKGDFAQASFGNFILGLAQNEFRKYIIKAKKDAKTDATDEDAKDERAAFELESNEITDEKKLLIREALSQLPENIRQACILHYLKGWKIHSKNDFEPTLTKYFEKSDRQIRNWLSQAEKILADWKGVLR